MMRVETFLDIFSSFQETFGSGRRLICMQDATPLPQDLEACHALIAELSARLTNKESLIVEQATLLSDITASRQKLAQEIEELNLAIQKLMARLYGHRRERFDDPAQIKLNFGDEAAVQEGLADAADEAKTIEYTVPRTVKKSKPRNEQLPEHLPRYEVVAKVAESDKHCPQHGDRQVIGYDETTTLEFERPKLRVRVTKYPKYA